MKTIISFLTTLLIPLSLIAQVPVDSLVAYYPFNGNADDKSGNGNHGLVHGATPIADRFSNENSAYSFDGVNDYIQLPLSIIDGEQGTLACWIQLADTIKRNPMFGAGDTTSSQSTFGFYVWSEGTDASQNKLSNTVDRRLCGQGYRFFYDSLTYPKVGDWHHVALTSDGVESKLYMDGILLTHNGVGDTGGGTGEWFSDLCKSNYAFIGRRKRQLDDYSFNGIIDEFRIYNRALEESELMALYNDGVCQVTVYDTIYHHVYDTIGCGSTFLDIPQDSLTAYYPFNGNANDESGNEIHGSVIGAKLTENRLTILMPHIALMETIAIYEFQIQNI